jgi:glutamine amidotransferase
LKIAIIDLGINNLASLIRALESIDNNFQIEIVLSGQIENPTAKPHLLILPGVGNFGAASEILRSRKFDSYINTHLHREGKVIGICLGMQLLLQGSEESPGARGLGIIPGIARRLSRKVEKVPNVGWNEISFSRESHRFYDLNPHSNFYFTHSFYADVSDEFIIATSTHGDSIFPAIIGNESVVGIQFHPEKSGLEGKSFLKRIIEVQIR